jgi:hypothetical protein
MGMHHMQMRNDPMWPAMEKVARTLAYDGSIMANTTSVQPVAKQSVGLVIDGEKSDAFLHLPGASARAHLFPMRSAASWKVRRTT